MIPGGENLNAGVIPEAATKYCGQYLSAVNGRTVNEVIVTDTQPFDLTVETNADERVKTFSQTGFQFNYAQMAGCAP